jgi:hypothetical protein
LLTSLAEPGSTEQADTSELEIAACEMSDMYSGVALLLISLEVHEGGIMHARGKNTCEVPEIAVAI